MAPEDGFALRRRHTVHPGTLAPAFDSSDCLDQEEAEGLTERERWIRSKWRATCSRRDVVDEFSSGPPKEQQEPQNSPFGAKSRAISIVSQDKFALMERRLPERRSSLSSEDDDDDDGALTKRSPCGVSEMSEIDEFAAVFDYEPAETPVSFGARSMSMPIYIQPSTVKSSRKKQRKPLVTFAHQQRSVSPVSPKKPERRRSIANMLSWCRGDGGGERGAPRS